MPITVREAKHGDEHGIIELIAELAQAIGETSPITAGYVGEYLAFSGSHVLPAWRQTGWPKKMAASPVCSAIPFDPICIMQPVRR